MTSTGAESAGITLEAMLAPHIKSAGESFATEHPRIDRAELDELVKDVSALSLPNNEWAVTTRKVRLAEDDGENDIDWLIRGKVVYESPNSQKAVSVIITHPTVLYRNSLDSAFQAELPDEDALNNIFGDDGGDGKKAKIRVKSLGEAERRDGALYRPTLAVVTFKYNTVKNKIGTKVGTRVIPDGRTTKVDYAMPIANFGQIFKGVSDIVAPRPERT